MCWHTEAFRGDDGAFYEEAEPENEGERLGIKTVRAVDVILVLFSLKKRWFYV